MQTSSSDAALASRAAAQAHDGDGMASRANNSSLRLAAVMVLIGVVSFGLRQLGGAAQSAGGGEKQHSVSTADQKKKEQEQKKK